MNRIYFGNLINDLDTGAQYLILWISSDNTYGFWYNIKT